MNPVSDIITLRKKNHARIQIDAEPSIVQEMNEHFSFFVDGYKFMPAYKERMWDGKINLIDMRNKTIGSGAYDFIEEFAKARGYGVNVEGSNYYGYPGEQEDFTLDYMLDYNLTSKGKKITPREYQVVAVNHLLKKRNAIGISPTASGKSLILYLLARYHLDHYDTPIIILVPTVSLVKQMYGDFADYSQYDEGFEAEELIHQVHAGKSKTTQKPITISTWQSVYKERISFFDSFGMALIDEAHTAKAKSIVGIMDKLVNARFRIGVTGTLDGALCNEMQLQTIFGKKFYVTRTHKLMEEGSIANLNIDALVLDYSDEEKQFMKKAKYQTEIDFLVSHPRRNNFIRDLALAQTGNTLVMFRLVQKHGEPLFRLIQEAAHERRRVFFVSGSVEADAREEIRRIVEEEKDAIIVASEGVFSTGVNIKNIHNIIFGSPSKSQIKVLQTIGRGLRKADDGRDTKLFDITDDLSYKKHKNFTLLHGAERIKIYAKEKFQFKITRIKL